MCGLPPLKHWNRGFESHSKHGVLRNVHNRFISVWSSEPEQAMMAYFEVDDDKFVDLNEVCV
jgi:hypothetical protein